LVETDEGIRFSHPGKGLKTRTRTRTRRGFYLQNFFLINNLRNFTNMFYWERG